MAEKYKIYDDIAIADIAFECYGKDLKELFENSAQAVLDESADVATIEGRHTKEILLESDSIENLLYDFLSEILYLKDTYAMIFKSADVEVTEGERCKLKAVLHGDQINQRKHGLKTDIKAITLHLFKVEQTQDGWVSFVVVDI